MCVRPMQVAGPAPGVQWGGDGCQPLPAPCGGGSRASPDTGLGIMLQAAALQRGSVPAPGTSTCEWLLYQMN